MLKVNCFSRPGMTLQTNFPDDRYSMQNRVLSFANSLLPKALRQVPSDPLSEEGLRFSFENRHQSLSNHLNYRFQSQDWPTLNMGIKSICLWRPEAYPAHEYWRLAIRVTIQIQEISFVRKWCCCLETGLEMVMRSINWM